MLLGLPVSTVSLYQLCSHWSKKCEAVFGVDVLMLLPIRGDFFIEFLTVLA